jgi:3-deoxy-7-phosphoheptulonate synthase
MTLIHRFGAKGVQEHLPVLIDHLQTLGRMPAMICDPMHGNTTITDDGTKTRDMANVLEEVERSIDIHAAADRRLSGIHIELTGENVTECTGGARGLTAEDLKIDYRSRVDPRLNYEQALELAILVAGKLGRVMDAPAQ